MMNHVITLSRGAEVIRTQIQLTSTQASELKRLAAEHGVSMASLIRDAVEEYLRATSGAPWVEVVDRASAAVGSCHSGLGDLSTRHDDYFAEAAAE
jgi:Ribbon-helix-helix protein, copG family